jgi:mono/diheme cytochrome c family protein
MRSVWVAALVALACAPAWGPAWAQDLQSADMVARGRYVATVADCAACHTAPGGAPYAGGLPLKTPFGTIVSSNITPDPVTGIGAWTDREFADAIRRGIGRGGRHLYPAMPYTNYTVMTDQDIRDLRAYLATIEPVSKRVVANRLPFPFDIRAGMIAWNALEFSPHPFHPDPAKSAEWNRGAYLVEGPGHCGACHTGKDRLGGDSGPKLAGGDVTGWYAPALDDDKRVGLGAWPVEAIVAYLKTGWGGGQVASGPMAEVVADSTSRMSDADLKAVAVYLRDQTSPAVPEPVAVAASDAAMVSGKRLYEVSCAACHGATGEGVAGLFPALAGSAVVQSAEPVTLIGVVLNGGHAVATASAVTAPGMPAFGWQLPDDQVAAIVTYIRNSWGNAAAPVDAAAVGSARKK